MINKLIKLVGKLQPMCQFLNAEKFSDLPRKFFSRGVKFSLDIQTICKFIAFYFMKCLIFLMLLFTGSVYGQQDILLSNYKYPFEVSFLDLNSQHQQLKMAYMDLQPPKPNGKTVVLLHGKNFNGA